MLCTPVLLIIFNRPKITQKVFDQIRNAKPRYLFVAADGPRSDKPEDILKCMATREIIKQVDWECDLKTKFSHKNRGCGYGPADAITWFFTHVEEGIILEDDCLPSDSFFLYCSELLERFRMNENISIISGTNPLKKWKDKYQSYIYSTMGGTWGWATWKRAWDHFDYSAAAWQTEEGKKRVFQVLKNVKISNYFSKEFDENFAFIEKDVWDFQWYFCRLYQQTYSIVPTANLISNIGFGEDATHTFDESINIIGLKNYESRFPLKHQNCRIDRIYDWLLFERIYSREKKTIFKRIVLKIIKSIF